MAHLDLLSRSRRGAAAYRLTSIVPLAPLDRPLSTCFRYCSAVLDVSWVKVHDGTSGLSVVVAAVLCIRFATRSRRRRRRRRRRWRRRAPSCVTGTGQFFRSARKPAPEATRHARCHPIGSEGRGGDVCIHRPAVFRSNKSSSRVSSSTGKSMLAAPSPPCIVRSSAHRRRCRRRCYRLPRGRLLFRLCFSILRRAYRGILTLGDVAATMYDVSRVTAEALRYFDSR